MEIMMAILRVYSASRRGKKTELIPLCSSVSIAASGMMAGKFRKPTAKGKIEKAV